MATILVVEDDKAARTLTQARLKPHYTVRCARDGSEAFGILARHHIDLAIVDVMMPHINGYELVDTLRSTHNDLPILMLTALDSFSAKRDGFAAGIDDYLTKPANCDELLWRVKALLRRAKVQQCKRIDAGGILLDAASYTAIWNDRTIELPKKEFDLIFLLLSYPGTIFSKTQLLERVWGLHSENDEASLKVHISRLRSRFADCQCFSIVTMRGLGYKAELTDVPQSNGCEIGGFDTGCSPSILS